MNPNQMNLARTMVARHEFLEEARRSRLQAEAERGEGNATRPRRTFHAHPFCALLSLGLPGRR